MGQQINKQVNTWSVKKIPHMKQSLWWEVKCRLQQLELVDARTADKQIAKAFIPDRARPAKRVVACYRLDLVFSSHLCAQATLVLVESMRRTDWPRAC